MMLIHEVGLLNSQHNLLKRFFLMAFAFLSYGAYAFENHYQLDNSQNASSYDAEILSSEKKNLQDAAYRYLKFLNDASLFDAASIEEQSSYICAPNCKKIINGKTVFEDRKDYAKQITDVKKDIGSYAVEPIEIIASPDNHLAMIRHLVFTENAGSLIVFVILRYNADYLITEINEVYNKKD